MEAKMSPLPQSPLLRTPLPGPNAMAIVERDRAVVSPSYTRGYPFVMARGEGAMVEDVDGNVFLDCAAGIAVNSTGHAHPDVLASIVEQAGRYLHMSGTDFYYEPQVRLAEVLSAIVPMPGPCQSFFGNSGTEANEAAIKLARYHTRRPFLVAFMGSFHGRTLGSLSLTASRAVQRKGFGAVTSPGVFHVPYPDVYRDGPGAVAASLAFLEERIFLQLAAPDEVAAIVVEPIQGEGGYLVPPPEFLQGLRAIADQHGILLMVDEVQSGMGRTGRMYAVEHAGVQPDVITMAKGIASGLPLGVATARAGVMDWTPGAHASTFGGNPVSCAAALTTIRLLQDGLVANAADVGGFLLDGLRDLQQKHAIIGDVRGKGLMVGVELVKDRTTKVRASAERDKVVDEAFSRGLLILGAGRNTIRFCPPLVLSRAQARTAIDILDASLTAVCG
ncbi:MAG: acetyl ornithine aminotransferase family protein [Acidobacteria bacterium]|nr:acetyl ornithine aminotransferase family protein [Acidobacteriota bacterium]